MAQSVGNLATLTSEAEGVFLSNGLTAGVRSDGRVGGSDSSGLL